MDEPVGSGAIPYEYEAISTRPRAGSVLFKWCVLAAPHYPILILLYLAYPLVTVVAGVAILFTGRYPRPLFDFNVGVLRWSWRVMNYRFPMNGTDKYPPFTLASRPDYPADLEVDYPRTAHELGCAGEVVAARAARRYSCAGRWNRCCRCFASSRRCGCCARGLSPRGMFDLLLGIVRWRYRVAVYVSLMRDEYPPFRLDLGSFQVGNGTP